MLLADDEFGRTQRVNNNAYCQDSEIGWLDWDIEEEGRSRIGFVRRLTELRSHYPLLRRSRFLTGEFNEELGVKDVTWINASGTEMRPEQPVGPLAWHVLSHCHPPLERSPRKAFKPVLTKVDSFLGGAV
jgi:pullulanase/glycogen debranching enzyme